MWLPSRRPSNATLAGASRGCCGVTVADDLPAASDDPVDLDTSTEPPASIDAANSAQMMLCEVPLSMSAAADARSSRMRIAMSGSEPPSVGEAVAGASMCSH